MLFKSLFNKQRQPVLFTHVKLSSTGMVYFENKSLIRRVKNPRWASLDNRVYRLRKQIHALPPEDKRESLRLLLERLLKQRSTMPSQVWCLKTPNFWVTNAF